MVPQGVDEGPYLLLYPMRVSFSGQATVQEGVSGRRWGRVSVGYPSVSHLDSDNI